MFRILHDTRFDFIKPWKIMAIGTVVWILLGFVMTADKHIPLSTEFTGGTLMQLSFKKPPQIGEIRSVVDQSGYAGSEVQQFGSDTAFTVRAHPKSEEAGAETTAQDLKTALTKHFGDDVTIARTEVIGPRVGKELSRGAIIAMLISFVVTMAYLAIRFEWRFGLAAVIASAHDILTTFAFIAIMRIEISLTVVAAILTVIGYSLNDTIIIFDRVRENLKKQRRESLYDVMNRSINETLPRSVLTHATTAAAVLGLLFFAGEVIRPFSWVMLFGIVTGTFSSIYVAGALLLYIERKFPRQSGETKGTARAVAADRQRAPKRDTVATR